MLLRTAARLQEKLYVASYEEELGPLLSPEERRAASEMGHRMQFRSRVGQPLVENLADHVTWTDQLSSGCRAFIRSMLQLADKSGPSSFSFDATESFSWSLAAVRSKTLVLVLSVVVWQDGTKAVELHK